MKIVCISDTHEQEAAITLPAGDVLVHAGDITYLGRLDKLIKFDEWCAKSGFPKDRILVCAGNHDLSLQLNPGVAERLFKNATYLRDKETVIDGVKFYLSPWTPAFENWVFMMPKSGHLLKSKWAEIPDDTNVLVTHGPPYGYADYVKPWGNIGDELLLERVKQVRPRYHVCGHCHEGYGMYETDFGTTVVNAATCNGAYKPVNAPVVIEI